MTPGTRRLGVGALVATPCFAALAALRAVNGDAVWAAVFAVGALGYLWLALSRRTTSSADAAVPVPTAGESTAGAPISRGPGSRPPADAARSVRAWQLLTTGAAALTAGVALWSEPALAIVGMTITVAAAVGWWRARRSAVGHSHQPTVRTYPTPRGDTP